MGGMDALAGLWVDATGRALWVEVREDWTVRVTVTPRLDQLPGPRSTLEGPARTEDLEARLDRDDLIVEAGTPGLGPTLRLELDAGQLRPSVEMGLYDDFDDDLGVPWAFPLLPYRRATVEEERIFHGARGTAPAAEPAGSFALAFRHDASLEDLRVRLDAAGPWTWAVRDSAWYGDYLQCHPTGETRIRIHSTSAPPERLLQADRARNRTALVALVRTLLTRVGARDVRDIEPYD